MKSVLNIGVVALALALICPPADAQDRRRLLRVEVKDRAQFERLVPLDLDITSSLYGSHVDVLIEPGDEDRIALLGFKYEVIIDDLETSSAITLEEGLRDYYSYSECTDMLMAAAEDYPRICMVDSIGSSLFGRAIWAIKISDNAFINDLSEADILFVALHHARELITPNVLIHLMNHLLSNYGTDPYVTDLVDNREIWIVPVLNPDGHVYVEEVDDLWRKNRRPPELTGCVGVDINRNYGFFHGYDNVGSSPYECDQDYRGPGPFSEQETRAIRDLVLNPSNQFKVAVSYHSYGDLILYPWGYTTEPTPDAETYAVWGDSMSAYNGYRAGPSYTNIYTTNGDFDDWMYGDMELWPLQRDDGPPKEKDRIFSFTFEVGPFFWTEDSTIPGYVEENLRPNLFVIEYGDDPYSVWPPETPEIEEIVPIDGGGRRIRWRTPFQDGSNMPVAFELERASGVAQAVDDFESGLRLWEGNGFEISSAESYSGQYSLHTGNSSNFTGNLEPIYALHPVIGDSLKFKCWYSLPLGHNFFIEVSDDGGQRWFPLRGKRTLPGEPPESFQGILTGESNGWADIKMSLGNYVGRETLLRLRCSTISSEPTGGVYVDDFGPIVAFEERHTIDMLLTSHSYDVEPFPTPAIFRVRAIDADGQRSRWSGAASVPGFDGALRRLMVTPNPVSSAARVSYLAFDGNSGSGTVPVKLEVFDAAGRLVRTLFEGEVQGDKAHEETWDGLSDDGDALPSGVYFVVLSVRNHKVADKVMLISGP